MITESISCILHSFAIHWARIHASATKKGKPQKQCGDDLNPDVCKCERYGTIYKACVKSPSPLFTFCAIPDFPKRLDSRRNVLCSFSGTPNAPPARRQKNGSTSAASHMKRGISSCKIRTKRSCVSGFKKAGCR